MNTIRIECTGADVINIDDLTPFQGDLKDLTDENYEKLKRSILDLGFTFPIAVWKHKGVNNIIDAHQRVSVLNKMKLEGFEIPKLPVVWINAKNKKEAAQKLLAVTSQYGEVTNEGMKHYIAKFDLDIKSMTDIFNFPEINLDDLMPDMTNTKEVSFTAKTGSKELNEDDFKSFNHECPKCGFGFD